MVRQWRAFADQLEVSSAAVEVGGVEHSDAQVQCTPQRPLRLLRVDAFRPVEARRQRHASEALFARTGTATFHSRDGGP